MTHDRLSPDAGRLPPDARAADLTGLGAVGLSRHARDVLLGDVKERQCTARSRNGERCRNTSMLGQHTCRNHGGKTPWGLAAGHKRMLAICEPIFGVFENIVAMWLAVRCPACGNPTGDPTHVIRVGQLMLDRAGFGPHATIDTTETVAITKIERVILDGPFTRGDETWRQHATAEELAVVDRIMNAANQRAAVHQQGLAPLGTGPNEP